MKRAIVVAVGLAAGMCAAFVVADALDVTLLRDPTPWLRGQGAWPAIVGVALLAVDVLMPVPSSVVMIALGATYGVALGTLLSLAGALAAAWLGLALGRRGGAWILGSSQAHDRSKRLLARWGPLAIAATRPIPVIAETTAIMAGAAGVGWTKATLATVAGALPPAAIYAWAGAHAAAPRTGAAIAAGVISGAGALWILGHRWSAAQPGTGRDDE